MPIDDYINPEHEGFYYEPDTGRLFKIIELNITEESKHDGKVRATRKSFLGAHRLCTHIVFYIMTGTWPATGNLIDHKNNNAWDNSWDNLREATYQQNAHNRQPRGNSADITLETGVEITPHGRFRVKVRGVHIGSFLTKEEANACSIKSRKEIYGEFDYNNNRELNNGNE